MYRWVLSLPSLYCRWFDSVWVIQDPMLGPEATVACGKLVVGVVKFLSCIEMIGCRTLLIDKISKFKCIGRCFGIHPKQARVLYPQKSRASSADICHFRGAIRY
jgi:hypothetical protein